MFIKKSEDCIFKRNCLCKLGAHKRSQVLAIFKKVMQYCFVHFTSPHRYKISSVGVIYCVRFVTNSNNVLINISYNSD